MKSIRLTLRIALATLAFALVADAARACTYECVNVGPGFCRRCEDVGYPTGGNCRNSGSCGCFEVQDICFNSVSLTGTDQVLAALAETPEAPQALTPAAQPAVQ